MSITVAPGRLASRISPLLRETAFRRYWGAQSISLAGDQITSIALPLAAVLLTRRIAARAGVGRAYLIGCIVYPAPILLVPVSVPAARPGCGREPGWRSAPAGRGAAGLALALRQPPAPSTAPAANPACSRPAGWGGPEHPDARSW